MPAGQTDPALETLLLPFADVLLSWPGEGGALFLRAREGWPLHQQALPGLVCAQSFRADALALEQAGFTLVDDEADDGRRYPLVMVLPPRQREESRALFARAIARTAPGGRVLACVENNEGARSAQDDLARIAGAVANLSKNKCRVFWTAPLQGAADPALAAQWATLDAPRQIEGGRFTSRPGVFAWDRIDPASKLLVSHLPADLAGRAADLGAGFGYLTAELLARCPGINTVDLFEAEARALTLARANLAGQQSRAALDFRWHDVTAGVGSGVYDVIVTNPPFHTQGRADRPDIGRRFIAVAAEALKPGGRLWLVANRHLPYEAVLSETFGNVRTVAQSDGFKIVEAIKAMPTRTPSPDTRAAGKAALRRGRY
ncbi:class I SAM-dependent methyltransferase [Montanilutibacter psychrotolerans]|uniref:Class I SAM-dependent methyltransferase n=1 Tax=Montanilutibacter psychrotolerans TaxID=1327343 RepID=A0A3M8SN09_9GAMM|nr:class I SAM-dependent methyltransferase [Lysobacter psychrotolerans]RNF82193.1 class I SAM-dependent methyltransferase [Lysobacter psychrotolerans]